MDAEPPVEEVSLKITIYRERPRVVSYRVMLDVPRELILFVSGLLAAHRGEIGIRKGTRRLGCYRQALFALAWFRDKGDIPRLGRGFGLPQSTAYRYLDEVIEVVAARAPGLQEQLERALAEGAPYLNPGRQGRGHGPVPGENRQPQREDDRLVVFGEDP